MITKKPLWVWVDPSRECNLKCTLCYTKTLHNEKHLSPLLFDKLLNDIWNTGVAIQKLHLNWKGEPLMNPEFIELIKLLEARDIYFPWEFHTNGILIDEKYADDLTTHVKTGAIYVSIDGGNEESHEFNRGKETFYPTLDGLEKLLNSRKKAGKGPKIGVFQLDLGLAEESYDKRFLELVNQVDDWVRVQPFHPVSGVQFDVHIKNLAAEVTDAHIVNKPSNRWWLLKIPDVSYLPQKPCFWAGNALFFDTDGTSSICLLSRKQEGRLGNIYDITLEEILRKAEMFRENIELVGRQQLDHCKKCKFLEGTPKVEISYEKK